MGLKDAIGRFLGAIDRSEKDTIYGQGWQERAAVLANTDRQQQELDALKIRHEQEQMARQAQEDKLQQIKDALELSKTFSRVKTTTPDPTFMGPRIEDSGDFPEDVRPNPTGEGMLSQSIKPFVAGSGLTDEMIAKIDAAGKQAAATEDTRTGLLFQKEAANIDKLNQFGDVTDRDRFMAEERAKAAASRDEAAWKRMSAQIAARQAINNAKLQAAVAKHGTTQGSVAKQKAINDETNLMGDIELLQANLDDISLGPIVGALDKGFNEWFGRDASKSAAYAVLSKLSNADINRTSGTAVSANEWQRLRGNVLLTDISPTSVRSRLNLMAVATAVNLGGLTGELSPEAQEWIVKTANDMIEQGQSVMPSQLLQHARQQFPQGGRAPIGPSAGAPGVAPSVRPAGAKPSKGVLNTAGLAAFAKQKGVSIQKAAEIAQANGYEVVK